MEFHVGDTFYMIDEARYEINAYLVLEENVKRTKQGETVTYIVSNVLEPMRHHTLPANAVVYRTLNEVRNAMIDNATKSIDQMIAVTREKTDKLLPAVESAHEDRVISFAKSVQS